MRVSYQKHIAPLAASCISTMIRNWRKTPKTETFKWKSVGVKVTDEEIYQHQRRITQQNEIEDDEFLRALEVSDLETKYHKSFDSEKRDWLRIQLIGKHGHDPLQVCTDARSLAHFKKLYEERIHN